MMTSILRRGGLLLSTGLLTWSLSGCVGKEPEGKEDDDSSDTKKSSDDDKKDKEDGEDGEDTDSDGDSDGKGSDGSDKDPKDSDGDSDKDVAKDSSVVGTVVDASGDPVAGVGVGICGKGGTCLPPVPTDKKGKFEAKKVPGAWKAIKASVSPGEKFEFFAGSAIEFKMKKAGEEADVGQLTYLEIDAEDKGTSFKDVEEEKTFTAGKFKFKLDGSKFDAGVYTDEDTGNEHFAVVEVPKSIWRDEEKEIEGNKVVSVWGMFPFGGSMNDGSASLTIDDDLGIDDGTELVLYQLDGNTGEVSEVGETKVEDGAIAVDKGLTKFARLYIAEKG